MKLARDTHAKRLQGLVCFGAYAGDCDPVILLPVTKIYGHGMAISVGAASATLSRRKRIVDAADKYYDMILPHLPREDIFAWRRKCEALPRGRFSRRTGQGWRSEKSWRSGHVKLTPSVRCESGGDEEAD